MQSPPSQGSVHDRPVFSPNAAWLLWRMAEGRPTHAAIRDGDRTVSYGALRDQAAAIATQLAGRGLAAGDRVAILLERGPEAAAAFFGTLAAGGIAINVNESLRARQVEHVLSHSGAKVLITTTEVLGWLGRTPETSAQVLLLDAAPSTGDWVPVSRVGWDPAKIIYTSGSTGLPKGVLISHANLWAGAESIAAYTGLQPDERIASLLPFSFDYGFNQLLTSLLVGATLVIQRSPLVPTIVRTLREERVSVLPCVPPLWLQLLGSAGFRQNLPELRVMTNTGGHLPAEAVRQLREAHPQARLYLMYGLTEAFRSTYLPPEEVDRRPGSIGRAIPGAQIMVLVDGAREAAVGEEGELVHRGPTVALGYWNDPEATARVYRPNPLRPPGTPDVERVVFSGDIVRRDVDGFLYYVGRRDRIIKTMGYRVSPDEVAAVLYASGQVLESIITTEPDATRGNLIIAHVVLTPGGTVEALHQFAATEMPKYMQPSRIQVHASLPRTTSGKHDTKALMTESST